MAWQHDDLLTVYEVHGACSKGTHDLRGDGRLLVECEYREDLRKGHGGQRKIFNLFICLVGHFGVLSRQAIATMMGAMMSLMVLPMMSPMVLPMMATMKVCGAGRRKKGTRRKGREEMGFIIK